LIVVTGSAPTDTRFTEVPPPSRTLRSRPCSKQVTPHAHAVPGGELLRLPAAWKGWLSAGRLKAAILETFGRILVVQLIGLIVNAGKCVSLFTVS